MSLLGQPIQPTLDESSRTRSGSTPAYFSLDPNSAAKQMAALNATSQLRRTSQSGGTSESIFGSRQSPASESYVLIRLISSHLLITSLDSLVHQQRNFPNPAQVVRSRRDDFYKFLSNVMNARGTPLPPSITGIPSPYDPTNSRWGSLEPSSEPGGFKLYGKDIDLFKLWHLVMPGGGHNKLNRENAWSTVLPHFGMPEEAMNEAVVRSLAHHSNALLLPLEEAYIKNMHQQKMVQARQQQLSQSEISSTGMVHPSLAAGSMRQPSLPLAMDHMNQIGMDPNGRPTSSEQSMQVPNGLSREEPRDSNAATINDNELKRKLQEEEAFKRVRQRTESFEGSQVDAGTNAPHSVPSDSHSLLQTRQTPRPSTTSASSTNRMRRKIEYVPYSREIETYGGRDLDIIELEWNKLSLRRPQRLLEDWGTVDIEGLSMSLRSRLPIETTYALTILTILSTMRGPGADQGFNLHQCDDLMLELLELLRDQALGDTEDTPDVPDLSTHRELVDIVREQELTVFPHLSHDRSGYLNTNSFRRQIIYSILNLLRNFSLIADNQRFMGQHPEVLNLLLRISCFVVTNNSHIRPTSHVLTLPDLVKVRKEVLAIVANFAPYIVLSMHPSHVQERLFALLASFIMDPCELCSPAAVVMQSGALSAASVRPPPTVDLALDAFSKVSQPDQNREEICKRIDSTWFWSLFTSLVHRLPVSSEDFAITMRMHEVWLSYLEKVVMSIYSLCFLATPQLKIKIKTDRTLGFVKVVLRMVKRFVSIQHPEMRQYFIVSSRRAVEALKLVDDEKDVFESPQTTGPVFAFGMGFGESDTKQMESGTGLLAGFQDDVAWSIMLLPHVDDVMFAELESLCRISI
ncbi:hypothetical protein Clacol_003701 [Clathrus columnatus]|uniref:ARID domain-containing protein n=1 Tax=Clathrus columnatus TaxID=1419009 RepID=A0AAV5A9Z4_9AGAM|nr:hypothetical protein Clacol_003701 [Clathrus columnatus]